MYYIVQKWLGVGLGAPVKVYILYTIMSIFYKCMQTIKLRQTTEGPASQKWAKGVPWASKSDAKGVLTKLQYVTSWEWERVG